MNRSSAERISTDDRYAIMSVREIRGWVGSTPLLTFDDKIVSILNLGQVMPPRDEQALGAAA